MGKLEENNKLIAEFMGAINENGEYDLLGTTSLNRIFEHTQILYFDIDSNDQFARHFFKPKEMKFNTSWDWLMLVVEKCYDCGELHNEEREGIIETFAGIIDIGSTYKAVIEYIKWHNANELTE